MMRAEVEKMNLRKASIIGDGAVGSSIAFSLAAGHAVNEIVIVDLNHDKAEGDALDIADGMSLVSVPKIIRAGFYEDIKGSHIVIIAAGAAQKNGETRLDLLKKNASIVLDVAKKIKPHLDEGTLVLVVSNPVDLLTHIVAKELGLPHKQVFGSGTVLDTSRLKVALAKEAGVDPRSVHAFVVGEHGDSEVPLFSSASIGGLPLSLFLEREGKDPEVLKKIHEGVRDAAYEIIKKKGATYYAVALGVSRIVSAVLNDEASVLTVSSYMEDLYGEEGKIYLSLPAVVSGDGVEKVLLPVLSKEEKEALIGSAEALRSKLRQL